MNTHQKWVIWIGCFVMSTNAVAQSDSAQPHDPIEENELKLLDEGYALRKLGRDAEALSKYEQAFALRGDKKALAQMALTKVALGDWVQSYALLKQALSDRNHPWILTNRELLESELDRIKKSTATLTLEVTPPSSVVTLNGRPLGVAQLVMPLMLNPGPASLDITARDYAAYHGTLYVEQGRSYHEVVHLVRNAVPTPKFERSVSSGTASGANESVTLGRHNPMWIGAALGGVLLSASAIVPWVMANQRIRTLEGECRRQVSCDFEGASHSINQLDLLTNILLFSGIGVASTSTALYFTVTQGPPRSTSSSLSVRSGQFQLGYSGRF